MRFYWCFLDYVGPNVCLNWLIFLIFCSKQVYLVPSLAIAVFLNDDDVQTVHIDLCLVQVRHGHGRKWYWAWRYRHCRCCLPYLTWRDQPRNLTSSASSSSSLLLPRTSNSYFAVETPSSSSPRFKASAWLPSKKGLIVGVPDNRTPFPLWNLVIFSFFERYLEQEKVVRMDFAEGLNPC